MDRASQFEPLALGVPGVRVRTLVGLRWFAICGQLATLAFVQFWLGYPLPLSSTLAAVAASAVLNIGLSTLYARNVRLEGGEAALHFGFDLVQLGVLLFLTGGLSNPFSVMLAVPITIAATLLSARAAIGLTAFALLILVILWRWALPLPWAGDPVVLPGVYRFGTFAAVGLGLVFLVAYTVRVSDESRKRAQALVATQSALEREARMSALGSLAAAAAHELGGPLGTITLIARDLADQLGNDPDFGDDIALLGAEAKRAREILTSIARRGEEAHPFPRVPLPTLLGEVADSVNRHGKQIDVESDPFLAANPPVVPRSPEMLHGISNFVANAARHAQSHVVIHAGETAEDVIVAVIDDGPGFPADLLPHLGEPFLGATRNDVKGLGLGVFIATTLLERTGARIAFANADSGGALVEVRWPRNVIEGDASPAAWPADEREG